MNKILIFLFALFISSASIAEEVRITPQGCSILAGVFMDAATARNSKIPRESLEKELNDYALPPPLVFLVKKELGEVYGVYKDLKPETVGMLFHNRCLKAQGSIETLSKDGGPI